MVKFIPKNKITREEKEELINKFIYRIDSDLNYATDVFATVFKDPVEENIKEWDTADKKTKRKAVKSIIKYFDDSFISYARTLHGMNIQKVLKEVEILKDRQLKEFGIRK